MTIHPAPKPKPSPRPPRGWNGLPIGKPIARSTKPIARSTKPIAKTPVKKRNAKRKVSEFARAYGSKARVEWVKSRPCVAWTRNCQGPIHNHHIKNGGGSRKADARFIVPLCELHHGVLHRMGRQSFESGYNCHLETWAATIELQWRKHVG